MNSDTDNYDKRVRKYESEGLTRSDAQGVVDAENMKAWRAYECFDGVPCSAPDQSECDEKCRRLLSALVVISDMATSATCDKSRRAILPKIAVYSKAIIKRIEG